MQELLAWLLLHRDQPQSRQKIAFQFWPDCPEQQAKTNLRNVLYYLRKYLPEADRFLTADQKKIRWKNEALFYLDVDDFRNSLKNANKADVGKAGNLQRSSLIRAEELYKGPLLETIYTGWIEPIRQQFEEDYLHILNRLVELYENEREYGGAVEYANKWVKADPFSEEARYKLIQMHALAGDRSAAIREYEKFENFLQEEMGISPSQSTKELLDRLQSEAFSTDKSTRKEDKVKNEENWIFVGRTREWNKLIEGWKQVLHGDQSRMILNKGESGIGKSRLADEFSHYLQKQGYRVISSRSYASAGTVSYGIVIDCLRHASTRPLLDKIDPVWLEELQRLLPELKKDVPDHKDEKASQAGPWSQRRLLEAITRVFTIDQKPKAILLDDLQWCDAESIGWLDFLLHSDQSENIMVVGNTRPVELEYNRPVKEVLAALHQKALLTEIELHPLDRQSISELVRSMTGSDADQNLSDFIYRETEGNPLFIVEFLRKGALEDDIDLDFETLNKKPVRAESYSERIYSVINNRFQYLSPETRELMELAAAIGRECPFVILLNTSGLKLKELVDRLDEMLEHRIIREKNAQVFDFTHDKLREVAYSNISRQRRKYYHKNIAESYLEIHAKNLEEYSSRLAYHFEKAGEVRKAVSWYEEAARNARKLLSKQDVYFYQQGLRLLEELPEDDERNRLERDLQAGLAVSLLHLKEHNADEVVAACERVRELCDRLGEAPAAPILFSFSMAKLLTGELSDALATGKEMIDVARGSGDPIARVKACYIVGGSALYLKGDVKKSRPYLEEGLEYYDPKHHKTYMKLYDLDAGLVLRAAQVSQKLLSGQEEKAFELSEKAFDAAIQSDQPFNVVYMYYMKSWWMVLLRRAEHADRYLQRFMELKTTDYELFHWSLHSKVFQGWAKALLGSPESGMERMQEGISELQDYRFIPDLPYYYGLLAEVLMNHDETGQAMEFVELAVEFMNTWDVRFPEAEICRIRGELLMKLDPANIDQAKRCLEKSIRIAKNQGAKLFEERSRAVLKEIEMLDRV